MEILFVYLLKSTGLVAAFWLAYILLLKNETFFNTNRWYLVGGLFASIILPLITFKKVIFVESQSFAPIGNAIKDINVPNLAIVEKEFDWFLLLGIVYIIGTIILTTAFLKDFYALRKMLHGKKIQRDTSFKLLDTTENVSPFSYFNYIVFNSRLYDSGELENILAHEKVHSDQKHSVDVLVARFFCVVFWFNPFIWLYRKSMLQNLEFIADSEATKNISNKKSYQITLLKVTAHENCVAITNHFYQSLIKKRIVMLNKNQSEKWNSWKYALIIPIVSAFMFYFQVDVIAQEKQTVLSDGSTISAQTREVTDMTWTKNSTDAAFKMDAATMKKSGIIFKFSKIKRNSKDEIVSMILSYKDKLGNQQTINVTGNNNPIEPIRFLRDIDQNGKGQIGFTSLDAGNISDENQITGNGHIDFNPDEIETDDIIETAEYQNAMPNGNGDYRNAIANNSTTIIDTDKILAEMDPIVVDGIDVIKNERYIPGKGKKPSVIIDTKSVSREAMENATSEMEKAREKIQSAQEQINAQREMAETRRALALARQEMIQAKLDLAEQKAEIEREKIAAKKQR